MSVCKRLRQGADSTCEYVHLQLEAVPRCFHPTEKNNNREKWLLAALVGIWMVLELGSAYGVATFPDQLLWIRELVKLIMLYTFGRIHEREVKRGNGKLDSDE